MNRTRARARTSASTSTHRNPRTPAQAVRRSAAVARSRRAAAERWTLYEASVQSPAEEVEFMSGIYRRRRDRAPLRLREDFCGSAALAAAWVASRPDRHALALDLDPMALAHVRKARLPALGAAATRLDLRLQDVRQATAERFDLIAAYNFSYFVFKRRADLVAYFAAARAGLRPGGMLFLDHFGGTCAQQPALETRELEGGVTYIWEQASYDPVTSDLRAYIHFRLADGTMLRRAFAYDWRLWQLAEIREALADAGFLGAEVYWEDRDVAGVRLGTFRRRRHADPEPAWNAYVIAER